LSNARAPSRRHDRAIDEMDWFDDSGEAPMPPATPEIIHDLIDRFARQRAAYPSPGYKEAQRTALLETCLRPQGYPCARMGVRVIRRADIRDGRI